MATMVPVAVTVQDSEAVPAVAEEVPGDEEVPVHTPEAPEGNNIVGSILINENLVIGTDSSTVVTQVEHAEVAASKDPVQVDITPGSDVPVMEKTFVQPPADDVSMEDMADTHDSYDAILDEAEGHVASAQAADMEVIAPVTAHTSPTKTGEPSRRGLIPTCCPPYCGYTLLGLCEPNTNRFSGSGNETVAEEEGRHQTAAVESAIRGQPGLLFAAKSSTLGASVLADMDAFFREFDHTRILTELRAAEAHVAALRDALNMVAPNPWDLASARRVSAESHAESALHGLLS
uniref:Uncharacterized protein n=1 Tax=Fagus sylvatica TaxID=28930 RepID=A0A2N9HE54_FAGSY